MLYLRFAKCEAIHFSPANLASADILHFARHKVDWAVHLLASLSKTSTNDRGALIVLANSPLRLIHDHDLRARFCHPDHLFDGPHFVGKEVDAPHVKHAVEGLDLKRQSLSLCLKNVRLQSPIQKIALAFFQHPPGNVDPVKIDVSWQKPQIGARSNRSFQYPGVWFQFEFIDEFKAVVWLAGKPVIKPLSQVVTWCYPIVERLVF